MKLKKNEIAKLLKRHSENHLFIGRYLNIAILLRPLTIDRNVRVVHKWCHFLRNHPFQRKIHEEVEKDRLRPSSHMRYFDHDNSTIRQPIRNTFGLKIIILLLDFLKISRHPYIVFEGNYVCVTKDQLWRQKEDSPSRSTSTPQSPKKFRVLRQMLLKSIRRSHSRSFRIGNDKTSVGRNKFNFKHLKRWNVKSLFLIKHCGKSITKLYTYFISWELSLRDFSTKSIIITSTQNLDLNMAYKGKNHFQNCKWINFSIQF